MRLCEGRHARAIVADFSLRSADEKPRYQSGAYAMMGGYIAKLVAHAILWVVMYMSNKSRDTKLGPADTKLAAAAGMEDKTESVKHNPYVFLSASSQLPSGSGSRC